MNAIGGQEDARSLRFTPAEAWETTGRIDVPILFHLDEQRRPAVRALVDARGVDDVPRA